MSSEKRFDLGAGLVLVSALAFAALVVAVTVAILALPADGWQIPGSSQTTTLAYFYGAWPTPLRAGDEVLAVNGLDVSAADNAWLIQHSLPDWRAGATVSYTVLRAGQRLTVPVMLYRPDTTSILRALAHAALDNPTEWSWPLIALVVFWLRPGSHTARLLLLAMVSHAAVVKLGWAASVVASFVAPPGLFYLNQLALNFWLWLFWPTVIWLMLSFPLPVWPLSRWPRAVPLLLYALPAAGGLISFATGNVLPFTVGLVGELAALLVALVLAAVNAYRHANDAVARAQVAWVILGFALSQGLVLAVYLIDYFQPFLSRLPSWINYPIPLILPVCLAIAITRYRLFDVDVLIRRTLERILVSRTGSVRKSSLFSGDSDRTPVHQPGTRSSLWFTDGTAGRDLLWQRGAAAGPVRSLLRPGPELANNGPVYSRHRRAVRAFAPAHPGHHRPELLPPQV